MQEVQLLKKAPFKRHVIHPDGVPLGDNNFGYYPWASVHKAKPDISEDELMERTKEARFMLWTKSGGSPFGFVFDDGTYELFPSNECLGLINCSERICEDKPVSFFVTAYKHMHNQVARPASMAYCHWLLNDSPYAENFVTKDAEEALKQGAILKTDNCVAFVVASAAAFRYLSNGSYIDQWFAWRKHVPEDIAFVFAHYFRRYNAEYYMFSDEYSWHSVIAKNIGIDGIKRFVTRDKSLHDIVPMRDKPYRYEDFSHLWRTRDEASHVEFKPTGEAVTFTNKNAFGANSYTYTNMFKWADQEAHAKQLLEMIGYPYDN